MGDGARQVGLALATAWRRVTGSIEWATDRFDRFQQRHTATAVLMGVLRKWSDDRAGRLAGQISYSSFLAMFPMLLVALTVLGVVLHGHEAIQHNIINSALRQFPVVGSDLRRNVHQLSTGNLLGLAVGLVWLSYGSMRLSRSAQIMMAKVWDVNRDDLPTFWNWLPRSAAFLALLGLGFVVGGASAGLGTFGGLGDSSLVIGLVVTLVVNTMMYWGAFSLLVRVPESRWKQLPGAVMAGAGWTALQFAGAQLINHQLRHLSDLYGTFATVLGLIWWMALGAVISVYAAECNVVLARHLWPGSFRRRRHEADRGPRTQVAPVDPPVQLEAG